MSDVTVKQLATTVGMPVDRLLQQLNAAGVSATTSEQTISDTQKRALLLYLQQQRGAGQTTQSTASTRATSSDKQVVLKRKSVSQLSLAKDTRGSKTVNVEVRKKKTYIKREAPPVVDVPKEPVIQADTATEAQPAPPPSGGEAPTAPPPAGKGKGRRASRRKERAHETTAPDPEAVLELPTTLTAPNVSTRAPDPMVSLKQHGFAKPTVPIVYDVTIPETITVADLAKKVSIKAAEIIKLMMGMGVMATINQVLDQETAVLVVEEIGHRAIPVKENDVEHLLGDDSHDGELESRAPVVTIMGHVDHGKTSLLDYIRRAKVASGEAGGITQHIGAYHVSLPQGALTFLDTPGHAAFTAMRARGTQVTDIVVLVVAADDGVKPQTIEAIQHAKAAQVPLVVAVNKIDKDNIDVDRVTSELATHDVISEQWGGDTLFVPISAITGAGVDKLLDAVLLQAELLELKVARTGPAKGIVLESRLDKGRGPVSSILVQSGTLRKGDMVLAGLQFGRVRALIDDRGQRVDEALPAIPVEVLGLSGVSQAGDDVLVVSDERKAREVALFRQGKYRDVRLSTRKRASLQGLLDGEGDASIDEKQLNVVLKTDVQGSSEAIQHALAELSTPEVKVHMVATGVGGITESDVNLAIASDAILVGFNVRADGVAKKLAEREQIDLRYYSVIYDVVNEVKQSLAGLLDPEFEEKIMGIADVREVFRAPKIGAVAGCMVTEGLVKRHLPIRVLRDHVVIFEGQLESLRHFKEDVQEIRQGMECGIGVKHYNDVKVGDKIEVFERIKKAAVIPEHA